LGDYVNVCVNTHLSTPIHSESTDILWRRTLLLSG
jgi:hypothetical protein